MKGFKVLMTLLLGLVPCSDSAFSFCGFYVGKADAKLFNRSSQVVLVRYEDKTVLTMANDYQGDLKEFALVIPVPTVVEKGQIHIGEKAVIDHLDAYSAPRLVEYYDDPCRQIYPMAIARAQNAAAEDRAGERAKTLGVTIEARYTVGEYDILILSAQQSSGLETWLRESGYRIPAGALAILGSYLRQGMKFFVAKVNLEEQAKLGYSMLRPLQVAYESPKFMLPIRLGMVNANGPQELFIYALTPKGRVETTNYRTVKLPTGMELPVFLKNPGEFGKFYKAMFTRQVERQEMSAVFLEYGWDMAWCDPCAADPLSADELKKLGVFWLDSDQIPRQSQPARTITTPGPPQAQNVFITRLHVRYDGAHFPEDLIFQETADRENFQGRYVLRHPWAGDPQCPRAAEYQKELSRRREQEAQALASLTGWDLQVIRKRMNLGAIPAKQEEKKWWEKLWGKSETKGSLPW